MELEPGASGEPFLNAAKITPVSGIYDEAAQRISYETPRVLTARTRWSLSQA